MSTNISNIRPTYVRTTPYQKPFEVVSESQHQYLGTQKLDVDDLNSFLTAGANTDTTLDIPEGTPVRPTSSGLKVVDGADSNASDYLNDMGLLVQQSKFYTTPRRRDLEHYGATLSPRDKSGSESIRYVMLHSFRGVLSYYTPKVPDLNDTESDGTDIDSANQPAIGDLVVVRHADQVQNDIDSGLWIPSSTLPAPVDGINNSMAPALAIVPTDFSKGQFGSALGSPNDDVIIIGTVLDTKTVDEFDFNHTGILLKARASVDKQNRKNYLRQEVLVNFSKPRIVTVP